MKKRDHRATPTQCVKGRFPKGVSGNPAGKPKGAVAHFTKLKDELQIAFEETGGRAALVKWAKKHPTDFYKIIAHLLPKSIELSGPDGGSLLPPKVLINFNFVGAKDGRPWPLDKEGNLLPEDGEGNPVYPAGTDTMPSPGTVAQALIEGEQEEEEQ
jgi:hypothetical protein